MSNETPLRIAVDAEAVTHWLGSISAASDALIALDGSMRDAKSALDQLFRDALALKDNFAIVDLKRKETTP